MAHQDLSEAVRSLNSFGDLAAPPGTEAWAIAMRLELHAALADTRSRKKHLTWATGVMQREKGYMQLRDEHNRPFKSWRAFCLARQPFGLGYDPDALDALIEAGKKDVADMAEETQPLAENGEVGNGRSSPYDIRATSYGTRSDYLTARIARDRPDILERMKAGEFRSVHQAAAEAGIVKPRVSIPVDVSGAARALVRHFAPADVAALIAELLSSIEAQKGG